MGVARIGFAMSRTIKGSKGAGRHDRTAGEQAIDAMLGGDGTNIILIRDEGFVGFSVPAGSDEWVRRGIRQVVAAAIDAEIAKAIKEDRHERLHANRAVRH